MNCGLSHLPQLQQTNATVTARRGTTVTANATPHTKSTTWISLIDPTSLASYGLEIRIGEVRQNATDTSILVDLAIGDASGGGNESILIANLDAGYANEVAIGACKWWYFPVYVPSGVSLSAKSQAVIGGDTCDMAVYLHQNVQNPFVGGRVTTYGAVTASSRGTLVTGGSGAFGSWTEIATTSRDHRYFTLGVDGGGDTTMAAEAWFIELGIGPDSANVTTIGLFPSVSSGSGEQISHSMMPIFAPVPSGTKLFIRNAQGTGEARGFIIYAID